MWLQAAEDLNYYDNERNFDNFRAEYQEKFGKSAYISPSHLSRWYGPPPTPRFSLVVIHQLGQSSAVHGTVSNQGSH